EKKRKEDSKAIPSMGICLCRLLANKYGGILTTISAHKMMIGQCAATSKVWDSLLQELCCALRCSLQVVILEA
ncbi:unnamed protein product, partial [Musa banksii]